MTIVMKRKVDIYLAHPERFQLDLINQQGIWMDNVVRPLGSHYEASRKQIDLVKEMIKARKEAHAARLAKIQMYQDIVMSIAFMAIDIVAAGALKNTSVLARKYSSTKDFDTFRNSADSFETAWKAFTSQKTTMVDAIIGNIDDKLKGLVSTGTVTSSITTVKALAASIESKIPAMDKTEFAGPTSYQNSLAAFYSSTIRSINEFFVTFVRDSSGDAAGKRDIIEHLVNMPICMPPTLSLEHFDQSFKDFFEISYWCHMVSNASKEKGNFGQLDDWLADMINQRLLYLTGHIFTHRAGEKLKDIDYRTIRKDTPLPYALNMRGTDLRVRWNGYCSSSQTKYAKTILADGFKTVEPLFISQGISCQQAYT